MCVWVRGCNDQLCNKLRSNQVYPILTSNSYCYSSLLCPILLPASQPHILFPISILYSPYSSNTPCLKPYPILSLHNLSTSKHSNNQPVGEMFCFQVEKWKRFKCDSCSAILSPEFTHLFKMYSWLLISCYVREMILVHTASLPYSAASPIHFGLQSTFCFTMSLHWHFLHSEYSLGILYMRFY